MTAILTPTIRVRKQSAEVFFSDEPVAELTASDVDWLKGVAERAPRKTARLCTHQTTEDGLQEMFIAHSTETYVRPHKHQTKSVSFHVIEGQADVVLFDDYGGVTKVIHLGHQASGLRFYCRVAVDQYYTQVITSGYLVFHESIAGPFQEEDTVWAPWAPDQNDKGSSQAYLEELKRLATSYNASARKN